MIIRDEFFKSINRRFYKRNQNWICAICGGTGSGKTYSAISFVQELNPRFDINKHIVFNVEQFMDLVNSGTLERGDIIIFEEAGVGMSSKEWHQLSNKVFNYVLQTFRHLGIGVIFTMPGLKLLDNSARILLHYYLETDKIDYKRNLAFLKVYKFEYNSMLDKIYKKYPVFFDDNHRLVSMPKIAFRCPDEKTLEVYEKMKNEFTSTLNNDISSQLEEKKVTKKVPIHLCSLCGANEFRVLIKEKGWRCKKCGDIVYSNPWKA